MKFIIRRAFVYMGAAGALAACSPSGPSSGDIAYPTDAQISGALQQQFSKDQDGAEARGLIRTLGGEKGALRYQIHHVIYRQGAYEARYDAVLVMGQPGAQSLQSLYASMIPEDERAKLPQANLQAYEAWLAQHSESLKKTAPQQAQALASTLDMLKKCYGPVQAGGEVTVMRDLGALLSPERNGWYAEKLAVPGTTVHCLPT